MAEILRASGRPLGDLVDDLPRFHTTPDLRLPWDSGAPVLEAIAAAFPPERVSRIDGVRVQFDDGWGLARRSVTEPALTLRFEARTAERLAEIQREFLQPAPELARRLCME
jgi:phosphomannomutase/phosphoglucomutase